MKLASLRLGPDSRSAELRCGLNLHPGGVSQTSFSTGQLACVWIQHGTGEMRRDGQTHVLAPGDAFLRLPGRLHDVYMSGPADWWFAAVPAASLEILARTCPRQAPVMHVGLDPGLAARWRATTTRLAACHEHELGVVACELLGLIAEVHRLAARAQHNPWLERACDLLGRDLRTPMPLIATAMGLRPSAFRTRFHVSAGVSPRDWRIRRRIALAQERLAQPGVRLEAVAEQLGYADLPTFAKQFKTVTGMAPGAWRKGLG